MAFLYGICISLGPGHGKIFVFSYILTEKPKVMKAISTSYAIGFAHGTSGLIVGLIIALSLKSYATEAANVDDATAIITRISFGLISAIGIFMLIKAILNKPHKHELNDKPSKFRLIPFVLSIGMVPCPGTIITVTFLASMGLLGIGIISSFFIMLGMGFTISLIGLISLFSKKLATKLYPTEDKNYDKLYKGFSIAGALMLIFFGVLFMVGTF